ncbi:MAG TPA: NADH-quinone oxidoreductase subunit J [Chloroflexi bacterium]|nr:NADH-quinone oxidoreductase subunit J [Chloroflexota bacterium]
MTGEQIIFGLIALVTLAFAAGMVTVNSVFHAALLMIGAFGGVAALFVTLNAGFLGVVQVLIYVGAIAVLVLFAVMLTPRVMAQQDTRPRYTPQWPLAAIIAVLLTGVLVIIGITVNWPVQAQFAPATADYAVELGKAFMGPYILPFEVASVVLLVALVGAIVIAREE